MIVTPFGDLRYEDMEAIKQWTAAHATRHETLRKELSRRGSTIMPALLFSDPGHEWVRVHYMNHVAMQYFVPPDRTVSVATLSVTPGTSEALFYNWHRMHNLIHARLDQALKVT